MTIFVWLVSWPIGSFVNIAKSFKQTCMTLYRYDQKKRKKHWQIRILNVCTSILKYIYSHFVVYEILIWLDLYVEHWRVNYFQFMTEKVKNVIYIYVCVRQHVPRKKKSLEFVIEVLLLEQVLSPKIGIPYQEYGQDTRGWYFLNNPYIIPMINPLNRLSQKILNIENNLEITEEWQLWIIIDIIPYIWGTCCLSLSPLSYGLRAWI